MQRLPVLDVDLARRLSSHRHGDGPTSSEISVQPRTMPPDRAVAAKTRLQRKRSALNTRPVGCAATDAAGLLRQGGAHMSKTLTVNFGQAESPPGGVANAVAAGLRAVGHAVDLHDLSDGRSRARPARTRSAWLRRRPSSGRPTTSRVARAAFPN